MADIGAGSPGSPGSGFSSRSGDSPISLDELGGYTEQELYQSQNWTGSEWREAIKQSLNYLLLRNKGDEVPGRSKIQSGDVADMLDHVQAEIQPMYAVEELVRIHAEGPGDEEQADQETQALNWYWRERLRGFEALDEAIQDGLLSRNGYLKVWYEESFGLPYEETFEGTDLQIDAALSELVGDLDRPDARIEPISLETLQAEVSETVIVQDPTDLATMAVPVVYQPAIYRAVLKVTPIIREVKGQSIAPEDLFISQDAVDSNMQKPRFVAHRRRMSRQDVKQLGIDPRQVDFMPATSAYDQDVRTARKSDYNTYSRHAPHRSGETVDLFECWYRIDRDGDGIPELWHYFHGGNREVLDWAPVEGEDEGETTAEMVRVRPIASGCPMRVAHRHQGRSLFDKEQQIEDTKRHLIRQMDDNLAWANDAGMVVGPGVQREDLESTEIPRFIRSKQGVDQVRELTYHNIVGDSLAGLAYFDKMRKERGGSAIEMSSAEMPVGRAAYTQERIMSAMEKLLAMYARNFANTLIRDTFVLLHQQLKLLPGKMAFESGDEWAETEPRLWMDRNRFSVTMGLSDGDKMRLNHGYDQIIAIGNQDMQTAPGVIIDYAAQYEARVGKAKALGLPDPESYSVNPESPQAQMALQARQQQADQDRQLALLQQRALFETQLRMTEMQEQTKRMRSMLDALEKQRDRIADTTVDMTKIEADLEKEGITADLPMGALHGDSEMVK